MLDKNMNRLAKGSASAVAKTVAVRWLGLVCTIATMLALARLVDALLSGSVEQGEVLLVSAIALAGLAVRIACSILASRFGYQCGAEVRMSVRSAIFSKLLRLGPGYHRHMPSSEIVQLAGDGADQIEVYFGRYLPQFIFSLLAPCTLFACIAFVNLPAAFVLLGCVPLIPLALGLVMARARRNLSGYWKSYAGLGRGFLENLQGLVTLKVYGSDGLRQEQMEAQAEDFRRKTMKVLKMQLSSILVMDLVTFGGLAAGLIAMLAQLSVGAVSVGGALAILFLAGDFLIPLRQLGSLFHVAMTGTASARRIVELLDAPEPKQTSGRAASPRPPQPQPCACEQTSGRAASPRPPLPAQTSDGINKRPHPQAVPHITMSNVCFAHEEARFSLQNVSLSLMPGLTAIAGESGSGKSTIASLLTGKLSGYSGSISVGGVELSDLAPEELAQAVTLVSHDSHLFATTVRDNLLMAHPSASDDDLWQALARVGLQDYLLADGRGGLNMKLEEGAANLSGGQRQRLAMARALLHDAPVYIFDEITSSIDVESEGMILACIEDLSQTRPVLMISHRLANITAARSIYMLEKGMVAESGTHAELLAQQGRYARLFSAQQRIEAPIKAGQRPATYTTIDPQAPGRAVSPKPPLEQGFAPASLSTLDPQAPGRAVSPKPPLEQANAPASPASPASPPAPAYANPPAPSPNSQRSGRQVVARLIGLVRSLLPVMLLAILAGFLGFAAALSISVMAAAAILELAAALPAAAAAPAAPAAAAAAPAAALAPGIPLAASVACMVAAAVLRSVLRYAEQMANHYLAFRLLASIRSHVFTALRRLAPAKLAGRDAGDLVSIITTDVELLEVFYAHTVSPVAIAIVFSISMIVFLGLLHPVFAAIAFAAYLACGIGVPLLITRVGRTQGRELRNEAGRLSALLLDSLRGMGEVLQYGRGKERLASIQQASVSLEARQRRLRGFEGACEAMATAIILLATLATLLSGLAFWQAGELPAASVIIAVVAVTGSFGAVVALASLSNNLLQTFAAGNRVLDLLEEQPEVAEVTDGEDASFSGMSCDSISFSYESGRTAAKQSLLQDVSLEALPDKILGIQGRSGCGKSTLLGLMMRFWDARDGRVAVSGHDIRRINTASLRSTQALMTQSTVLFDASVIENIRIAKPQASQEEVERACRKASLHEFVAGLPHGYDTEVGELGAAFSGGERQRVGLARAFLHDAPLLLLDEPTSNLDSLNEAVVLRALYEERKSKAVVLVSHRESTLGIADEVIHLGNGAAQSAACAFSTFSAACADCAASAASGTQVRGTALPADK